MKCSRCGESTMGDNLLCDDCRLAFMSEDEEELECMVCGETWMGSKPKMCCDGNGCGCQGLPIDPVVCSEECYNEGMKNGFNKNKNHSV